MTYPNPYTATSQPAAGERLTAEKLAAMVEAFAWPEPSPAALAHAAVLGLFALGVECCAGALPGCRIRVVALEPVTLLDLGVGRMKLARWYPDAAKVIELAAAGCWARGATG
ncbi:hypothetical protein [Sorangium sp. So ce388]|uniref:hypothetical protein n=1 Tax=Sorangium sp. So ce388 TaxID=3133309 RepID=UPI003F5B81DF